MSTKGYVEVDRNGLEVLDRDECLQLIATTSLARIGITQGALPVVLPINFRLVGDEVVFRTGAGTKLEAATSNAIVALEFDDIDPVWHSGWSVVVTGQAREVADPGELSLLAGANIPRWAPVPDERLIAVTTDMVSGRRLVPGLRPDQEGWT